MAQLSQARLKRYDNDLARVQKRASDAVTAAFRAWQAQHLNATVAETREELIELVVGAAQSFGDAAGELAASFYDERMEASGVSVPPAEIPELPDEAIKAIEKRVRYLLRDMSDDWEVL